MVYSLFKKRKNEITKDGHCFVVYDLDNSTNGCQAIESKLIPLIKELYLAENEVVENIKETGFNEDEIKKFIEKAKQVTIPSGKSGKQPKQLNIRRSDAAELIALVCLEELYKTKIPANSLLFRELTSYPGRGIDILGYEDDGKGLALIICEIKASAENNSPPRVVDSSKDCLKVQLYSYAIDNDKTLNRILSASKKTEDSSHKKALTKIAFLWNQHDREKLKVVICPFLVRQGNLYQETDFGSIKDNPDYFNSYPVRFLIVCVNEDLIKFSNRIFDKAIKN